MYNRWFSPFVLEHSGVKGMKWGVKNGPPYPLDKSISDGHQLIKDAKQKKAQESGSSDTKIYARDYDKANSIYKTLTTKEKRYVMGLNPGEKIPKVYVDKHEYEVPERLKDLDPDKVYNVFSRIEQYKDVPVSVIDIWAQGDGGADVSIITRRGSDYRGKGYASRAVEAGVKYFYDNPKLEYLVWGVNHKNRPSIELAKKYGFELYNTYDDGWDTYLLEKKGNK